MENRPLYSKLGDSYNVYLVLNTDLIFYQALRLSLGSYYITCSVVSVISPMVLLTSSFYHTSALLYFKPESTAPATYTIITCASPILMSTT